VAWARFLAEKELRLSADDLLAGGEQFYDFSVAGSYGNGLTDAPADDLLAALHRGLPRGVVLRGLGGHVIGGTTACWRWGWARSAPRPARRLETAPEGGRECSEASLTVCQAASAYARRYAARARELAQEAPAEPTRPA